MIRTVAWVPLVVAPDATCAHCGTEAFAATPAPCCPALICFGCAAATFIMGRYPEGRA